MPFDDSLRKTAWMLPVPLVMVAAFFNAQAVSALVGSTLGLDAKQLAAAPPSRATVTSAPATRAVSGEPILERNPFDHVTGSLRPPETSADGPSGEPTVTNGDPWSAPACDGVDLRAVAASDDADWSFASVAGEGGHSHLVRRGTELSGKKVYFIGWDRLWLTNDEALCQARLFDPKKQPAPAPAPAASAAPAASTRMTRSRAAPLAPDLRKGIQQVGPTEFNIDRGVVDRILENQAELMRQARVTPVQENGRVVGVRMMGIRQDSLLGVLGMQNGDRLQQINGFDMGSPEKALEAYARLRTADKLTVQINRNGKNVNLDYNIR